MISGYSEWYAANDCDHAHCPEGCEHPQPTVNTLGELICGRCWFKFGEKTLMVACKPDICE